MRESEIIARYFNFARGEHAIVGVGDDAAVLSPPPGKMLACSTDSLMEDVHFFSDADSFFLARKSAAVSLSDMAALGAKPLWMTVALAADNKSEKWFAKFAKGLKSSAAEHDYAIVGGDLCRAAKLCITTTIIGALDHPPLLRSGAKVGDDVWISGALGEAALAVHCRKTNFSLSAEHLAAINKKLDDPNPRLALGMRIAKIASAAMDISDGLASAAQTIAAQSGVKIVLQMRDIPPPPPLASLPSSLRNKLILQGGDDYELFFCAPKHARRILEKENAIRIGVASAGAGMEVYDSDGATIRAQGYEHDFGE